jgi:cell division protein FtsW
LLASGISLLLIFQVLLNIGGISRTIPLTGIPLPMLSAGGTSLIITLCAIGILFSINRQIMPKEKERKKINITPIDLNNKMLTRRSK